MQLLIYIFKLLLDKLWNNVDPDQMLQSAVMDLDVSILSTQACLSQQLG